MLLLCENSLHIHTFALRLSLFWVMLPFLTQARTRYIFNLFFKIALFQTKTRFEYIAIRIFWLLIENIRHNIENCF